MLVQERNRSLWDQPYPLGVLKGPPQRFSFGTFGTLFVALSNSSQEGRGHQHFCGSQGKGTEPGIQCQQGGVSSTGLCLAGVNSPTLGTSTGLCAQAGRWH